MFSRSSIGDLGQFLVGCEEGSPEIGHGEYHVRAAEGLDERGRLVDVGFDEGDAFCFESDG